MKDPLTPSAGERKKIMFYDSEDKQTKLRIRCQYDGISQSQFFRMMIVGYIESDPLIYDFISKCKEKYRIQGKNKRDKANKMSELTRQQIDKFSLNDGEIKDIFDTIEAEGDI